MHHEKKVRFGFQKHLMTRNYEEEILITDVRFIGALRRACVSLEPLK